MSGDAPNEDVAAFVGRRYGVRVAPQFVPVARASLRGLEQLDAARRVARETLAGAAAETPGGRRQRGTSGPAGTKHSAPVDG